MRNVRSLLFFGVVLIAFTSAHAQWEMQDSHTMASLRGIHAVNANVAWASGADGTILRTLDGGLHWQKCAVPPDGSKLDFRGIWAWDARIALVMSAGPGEKSRLYRTSDGCASWKEEARNPEGDGFWDAVVFGAENLANSVTYGVLLGDPTLGRFYTRISSTGGNWRGSLNACSSREEEASFAASNSSVFVFGEGRYAIGTGGKGGPRVLLSPELAQQSECVGIPIPLAGGRDSSGVFSLVFRDAKRGIAVGGDYKKPDERSGTAAWTNDGGLHWTAASQAPSGYRSAVAWFPAANVWIAAGTNGSDLSRDGGKSWQPLDHGNWNALSLPYAVGPEGRIGKLTDAIKR
jgi:photosystem II stability/assembly factor-like uncharacterized protein